MGRDEMLRQRGEARFTHTDTQTHSLPLTPLQQTTSANGVLSLRSLTRSSTLLRYLPKSSCFSSVESVSAAVSADAAWPCEAPRPASLLELRWRLWWGGARRGAAPAGTSGMR
jgi:hypothetical protein